MLSPFYKCFISSIIWSEYWLIFKKSSFKSIKLIRQIFLVRKCKNKIIITVCMVQTYSTNTVSATLLNSNSLNFKIIKQCLKWSVQKSACVNHRFINFGLELYLTEFYGILNLKCNKDMKFYHLYLLKYKAINSVRVVCNFIESLK